MIQGRVRALQGLYRQQLALMQATQDPLDSRQRMQRKLSVFLPKDVISPLELEQATAAFLDTHERVLGEQRALAETLADLDNTPERPVDRYSKVQKAQAELDRAVLGLSNAVVTAPRDGVVTNTGRLQVGKYLTVGAVAFDLADN
jgi:membrane fusion protein (multidrug efflux system)